MVVTLRPEVRALADTATSDDGFSGRVLLTTIFGDALLPRRQPIAVLQLARLVAPLGLSDRLVRTSLLRMTREELVTSERQGRLSFYRVHPDAEATFRHANARIYGSPEDQPVWDGEWTVAVVDPTVGSRADRSRLTDELGWLGLTETAPGVHVSPVVDATTVAAIGVRLGVAFSAVIRGSLTAGTVDGEDQRVRHADPEGTLRALHRSHQDRFRPFLDLADALTPEEAFVVRTLLLDGWRRIALRSPQLPTKLLPTDWPAHDSYAVTRSLHQALHGRSEEHVDQITGAEGAASSLFD